MLVFSADLMANVFVTTSWLFARMFGANTTFINVSVMYQVEKHCFWWRPRDLRSPGVNIEILSNQIQYVRKYVWSFKSLILSMRFLPSRPTTIQFGFRGDQRLSISHRKICKTISKIGISGTVDTYHVNVIYQVEGHFALGWGQRSLKVKHWKLW